jgi:Uma2 family endonuclease
LARPVHRLNEQEYLQIERAAQFKSEYFDGEMFAMSGGTRWHSLIISNLNREMGLLLKNGKSLVFDSNLRVKVDATGLLTYPDVIVSCEEQRFLDSEIDTLLNPTLIVEVLSDSTEAYDRGKKFENYRQIPSLHEYVLVSQTEPRLEQFIRQSSGEWLLRDTAGLENRFESPTLGIAIPLAEIFANVRFVPGPIRASAPPRA